MFKLIALRSTIYFILFFLLVSCQQEYSAEKVFDNYLYRLSNGLDLKLGGENANQELIAYPRKRALLYSIPEEKINFLQFLQLSNCELQRLIGQRNSSLGKFMSGYHSLLYHREFLLLAQQCLRSMDKGDALYHPLSHAITHKLTYREQSYWNALFAGDEFRYLFSISSRALSPEQITNRPTELIQALQDLNSWLAATELEADKLSEAYQRIEKTKWVGQLRITMALASEKIMLADALIQYRLDQRNLCFNGKANRQFNIVKNVFFQFYIEEVQVILSKLHQQAEELFGLLHKLQASQKTKPAFDTFWQQVYLADDSEWQHFNYVISKHTKSWQQLLKQCGFEPGKNRDVNR